MTDFTEQIKNETSSNTNRKFNNFIDIDKIEYKPLRKILELAKKLKTYNKNGVAHTPLIGKQIALIFEKPSTRTRASFEVGINQLGGHAIVMTSGDSQLGRGESIADTARVISRYTDIIMVRTFKHETLIEMEKFASVPIINGLTDYSHPCQIMADIMTFEEKKGSIEGRQVTWLGDYNNMTNSWIHAAENFNFKLNIACPKELFPPKNPIKNITYFTDPIEATKNADCITTDTWVSMGDENAEYKKELLAPYQVNDTLMSQAKNDAIFMHCLPAHREEEVTSSVIDGEQSVVWDEAENRLHAQKAIILWCLGKV